MFELCGQGMARSSFIILFTDFLRALKSMAHKGKIGQGYSVHVTIDLCIQSSRSLLNNIFFKCFEESALKQFFD